jgi:predicted Zn-dependent peptidase
VDHIEMVTAEEIQTLAATLFQDDKLVLTVLGPLSGVGPFQDAIRMI